LIRACEGFIRTMLMRSFVGGSGVLLQTEVNMYLEFYSLFSISAHCTFKNWTLLIQIFCLINNKEVVQLFFCSITTVGVAVLAYQCETSH